MGELYTVRCPDGRELTISATSPEGARDRAYSMLRCKVDKDEMKVREASEG